MYLWMTIDDKLWTTDGNKTIVEELTGTINLSQESKHGMFKLFNKLICKRPCETSIVHEIEALRHVPKEAWRRKMVGFTCVLCLRYKPSREAQRHTLRYGRVTSHIGDWGQLTMHKMRCKVHTSCLWGPKCALPTDRDEFTDDEKHCWGW